MNKTLKIILITIVSFILCYALYIGIEVIRFNNNTGMMPLIRVGEIDVDIAANSNKQKIRYKGLGYTVEYEYISNQKDDVVLEQYLNGEFRLFNKIRLAAWIS